MNWSLRVMLLPLLVSLACGCQEAPKPDEVGQAQVPVPNGSPWLAVGGGSYPSSNQVSIEQDLMLAKETFGPEHGDVFFAGGPGSRTVQVSAPPRGDELKAQLAQIFSPRAGRDARYTVTRVAPKGAATWPNVEKALRASNGTPRVLYFAGHGAPADDAGPARFFLWGNHELTPPKLASALKSAPPGESVVMTSCFSGAFADIVFEDADPSKGASELCGFFATTSEREAGGCDPNPNRAAQESYALHMLNALKESDRQGKALPAGVGDVDKDGAISLLDAHAQAVVRGTGIDVPTTTSERWLRAKTPRNQMTGKPAELAHERYVIDELRKRADLDGLSLRDLRDKVAGHGEALKALEADEKKAAQEESDAYHALAAQMLSRWPVLDDPWHPDFANTFRTERGKITLYLQTSKRYAAYLAALDRLDSLALRRGELLAKSAPAERLLRAMETQALAGALKRSDDEAYQHFERIRRCETRPRRTARRK